MLENPEPDETVLSDAKSVSRRGDIVLRPAAPWTPSVHTFLKHLQREGFTAAPRVVGSGLDEDRRETLSFAEGEFVHPYAWSDDALVEVGRMLRRLHDVAAFFVPPVAAQWQPWFLRELGGPQRLISHGDVAPWNTVTRGGMPITLIDWEYAGPVDPLVELARVCWLFPQLHDDDVAARCSLPSLEVRARQLRLLVDAYGLSAAQRRGLLDRIIEVVVCETAEQAIEANVTPESEGPQWGLAWRARAAAWILRHRAVLLNALA